RKLVGKNILRIKPYKPGKPIEELKRELKLKQVIKLASNENALSPSLKVTSAIKNSLSSLNRYPDDTCYYLKKKLAGRLGFSPSNLIIGNGSDEIIALTLRAFLNPAEEVVIARPTFLIYEIVAKIAGAKIKYVPLKDLKYDLKSMAEAVTKKTKIIFVANPDNPTGTYLTGDEVRLFLAKVPKEVIVYFDEAYFEFADVPDFPDTLKLINKRNIITTRTFSKIYSLAGLRIGYGLANKQIIGYLNRVREPFNVNSIAQVAALAALDEKDCLRQTLKMVKEGKKYIYNELEKIGLKYVPSATNFVLIDLGKNSRIVFNRLLKRGIIVRDMRAWKLDNFIRVTIGTMSENKKFIKAFKEVSR
ncbi:MAG: histidinol-phosphate transaminase, partial [Candidatus Omnitrophota bacterium]|nr:histidinol-phosphate transaminase [Candidatus Omnitrophota bacterium]